MPRAFPVGSARTRLGFTDEGGSVQARRQAAGFDDPSMRALLNEVGPETRLCEVHVEAGDVACTVSLMMASNGEFFAPIHLHDSGTFFGDNYTVSAALTTAAPDGSVFGFQKKGTLDSGKGRTIEETGRSTWLQDNWDIASTSGFKVHLKTDWDVEPGDVIWMFVIAGAVLVFGYGESTGKGRWRRDGDGAAYSVPLN